MGPMERALACHQCASRESAVAVRKHLSLLSHIGMKMACRAEARSKSGGLARLRS